MTSSPLLRVHGSTLEVIQAGEVIERFPLGSDSEFQVRIANSTVELCANGQVVDRYPLQPPRDREMPLTEIPVTNGPTRDHDDIMFH